jgi:hypothetical protein
VVPLAGINNDWLWQPFGINLVPEGFLLRGVKPAHGRRRE